MIGRFHGCKHAPHTEGEQPSRWRLRITFIASLIGRFYGCKHEGGQLSRWRLFEWVCCVVLRLWHAQAMAGWYEGDVDRERELERARAQVCQKKPYITHKRALYHPSKAARRFCGAQICKMREGKDRGCVQAHTTWWGEARGG